MIDFATLLKDYGYVILFIWSFFEGELGLITAGTMIYAGTMSFGPAILTAALGGATGDLFYFAFGNYHSENVFSYIKEKGLERKMAQVKLLLRKYGIGLIFLQRYLYGLRTVIPMVIGASSYSFKKFFIINLISAFVWATTTIVISYFFGKEILELIKIIEPYKYYILGTIVAFVFYKVFKFVKKQK